MREWCAVPRCSSAVEKSSGRVGHVHVKKEGPANGRSGQVDPRMLPKKHCNQWQMEAKLLLAQPYVSTAALKSFSNTVLCS